MLANDILLYRRMRESLLVSMSIILCSFFILDALFLKTSRLKSSIIQMQFVIVMLYNGAVNTSSKESIHWWITVEETMYNAIFMMHIRCTTSQNNEHQQRAIRHFLVVKRQRREFLIQRRRNRRLLICKEVFSSHKSSCCAMSQKAHWKAL